jgi:hypothetical protein
MILPYSRWAQWLAHCPTMAPTPITRPRSLSPVRCPAHRHLLLSTNSDRIYKCLHTPQATYLYILLTAQAMLQVPTTRATCHHKAHKAGFTLLTMLISRGSRASLQCRTRTSSIRSPLSTCTIQRHMELQDSTPQAIRRKAFRVRRCLEGEPVW